MISHYGHAVTFPAEFRTLVRSVIDQAAANNHRLSDTMRDKLAKQLSKLDTRKDYFFDLAAEEGMAEGHAS